MEQRQLGLDKQDLDLVERLRGRGWIVDAWRECLRRDVGEQP
jgi:hypothetical protein